MSNTKRFLGFLLAALFTASASPAQDQSGNASGQGGLNLTVFKDVSDYSDGLEIRKKTLESIRDAVSQGNTSDEIYEALEFMSKEGLNNNANNRNTVRNDYPDIRREVAVQLGKMGTERAANILVKMCDRKEKDFYVLLEVIRALGDIGLNENDIVVNRIYETVRGLNELPPNNIVTENVIFSAIDAFDKIDKKNGGFKNKAVFNTVLDFLERVSKNESFPGRPEGRISVRVRAKNVKEELLRRNAERG